MLDQHIQRCFRYRPLLHATGRYRILRRHLDGEPVQASGKQERYENLLNQYLLR